MSHHGVLHPAVTFTPVRTGDTVTTITVACTMYSSPLVQTMESRTVDGQTSDYGVTVTDEDNKITLGSDSITWSVPTDHQSTEDPYVVDWKYFAASEDAQNDGTEVPQINLIMDSTDYKNMMNTLCALQTTYQD